MQDDGQAGWQEGLPLPDPLCYLIGRRYSMTTKRGALTKANTKQKDQERVAKRQRKDLELLQQAIAGCLGAGNLDPSDVGHLSRSTKTLHELETKAHGFNDQTTKAPAIILMPVPCDDMADWQAAALKLVGIKAPDAAPSRLVAPDDE